MLHRTMIAGALLALSFTAHAADFSWAKAKEALPKLFTGAEPVVPIGYNVESPTKVWIIVYSQRAGAMKVPAYYLQGEAGVGRWFLVDERGASPVAVD